MFFKFDNTIFRITDIVRVFVSRQKLCIELKDGTLCESLTYADPWRANRDLGFVFAALTKKISVDLDAPNWEKVLLPMMSLEEINNVIKGADKDASTDSSH